MTESQKKKPILTRPIKWPWPLNWIFGFLFSRKMMRVYLFGMICLITLIIAFYTVENVRAKFAWSKHVKELESQGISTNYKDYIPPEIPDDENLAKIPMFAVFEHDFEPLEKKRYPWDRGKTIWKDPTWGPIKNLTYTYDSNYGINDSMGNWWNGRLSDLSFWQIYYRGTNALSMDLSNHRHQSLVEDERMLRAWTESTNTFPYPEQPGVPATDIVYALKKFDPIWNTLKQACNERNTARFALHYEELYECFLPHLSHIKHTHQYGKLRASAELHAGEHAAGTESISLMLRLVKALESEPFLISYLVYVADFHLTLHPMWEGMTHHLFEESELIELGSILSEISFMPQVKHALGMERAIHIGALERVTKHRSYFERLVNGTTYELEKWPWPWTFQTYMPLAPKGWILRNVQSYSEKITLLEQAFDQWNSGDSKAYSQFKRSYKDRGDRPLSVYNVLSDNWDSGHINVLSKALRAEATVNIAKTAVALERYYLNQSTYPESLSELVPQFLMEVPVDPIDLQPLRYQEMPNNQFKLYSIGANETDDGGEIPKDNDKGDWVWRWPIASDSQ